MTQSEFIKKNSELIKNKVHCILENDCYDCGYTNYKDCYAFYKGYKGYCYPKDENIKNWNYCDFDGRCFKCDNTRPWECEYNYQQGIGCEEEDLSWCADDWEYEDDEDYI